jgi:hypothetical protein
MAGAPTGGTTTNASSFSLNEDIKLPMGGRYQPTSSVGVFGGPQHTGMDAASTKNMVGKKMYYDSAGKGTLEYDRERMRSMEAEGIIPQHLLGGGLGGPMPMRRSGGPQTNNGMMMDLNPESPTNGQMIPRGGPQQATPNPNAQGFDSFRSNAGLPQPMALNSGVQQMAAPQQGGYNVNTASAQGLQQAQQGATAGMGYRPMAITAPSQAGLQQYTNPYESQVVQQSLDDLERSRLMAQNVGGAQASAANAFGGSRQGIAEAETNRAFADQAARTASGLRQTGYQNAQTMERQAQMQNQQAGLSGAQQRLNAGQQLGSLSNLGFGMGQTIQNRMDQQGAMQQALQQQLINAGKQQYAGYTGAPAQSLQYLLQAVGGAPTPQTTTEGYSPGLFDYLTLAGTTYAGIK